MSDFSSETQIFSELIAQYDPRLSLVRLEAMAPDCSLRRYFRVHLEGGELDSAVGVIYDSLAVPEAGGGGALPADTAYAELAGVFHEAGVSVPRTYAHRRGAFVIEDLGGRHLSDFLLGRCDPAGKFPSVESLYVEAVGQILNIQKIAFDDSRFYFQRAFTTEILMREAEEYVDYYLRDRVSSGARIDEAHQIVTSLCQRVMQVPRSLTHRDFHSWNLLVDQSENVRVIDFQDALLAPDCYDVAALLNDRDTDAYLGQCPSERVLACFFDNLVKGERAKSDNSRDKFHEDYRFVLLQRDMKACGRFMKLAKLRGLTKYLTWVDGTQSRILKSLEVLAQSGGMQARNWERLAQICRG